MSFQTANVVTLVESIPNYLSQDDIYKAFTPFGEIKYIQIFNFTHRNENYYLYSGIVIFSKSDKFALKRRISIPINDVNISLKITIKTETTDLESTALLFNVSNPVKTFLKLEPYSISRRYEISNDTKYKNPAYILIFQNHESMINAIQHFDDLEIQPIICDRRLKKTIVRPEYTYEEFEKNESLYDFYLIHFGNKYPLIRGIAKHLSKKINECKDNFIEMPDVPGPIQIVVDYLLLKKVMINPDANEFISYIFSFLGIKQILDPKKNIQNININNVIDYAKTKSNVFNFDYIVEYISSNLDVLVNKKLISQIPSEFIQPILEYASMNNENHDSMLLALSMFDIDNILLSKYIKYVDPKKLTKEAIHQFLYSETVNLNNYRDLILELIK